MNDFLKFMQDALVNACDSVIYSNHRSPAFLKQALQTKRQVLCPHNVEPVEVGDGEGLRDYYCPLCNLKR